MSITGRESSAVSDPTELATAMREASFVRLKGRADGDALAAVGLLARACTAIDVPFKARIAATDGQVERRSATDSGTGISVGTALPGETLSVPADSKSATATAAVVARSLDVEIDTPLALAGALAGGAAPRTVDSILPADIEIPNRRPGVAVPTTAIAEDVAHSTMLFGPFSGRPEVARRLVSAARDDEDTNDDGNQSSNEKSKTPVTAETARRLASLVAIEVAGDAAANALAGSSIETGLQPHAPGGPFATVVGYADVLDALSRAAPGTGLGLAITGAGKQAALAIWRDHALAAHRGVRTASTSRYDGLMVARQESEIPVITTARLLADFRSPEPLVLVLCDGDAGLVAKPDTTPPRSALRDAARQCDGEAGAVARGGYAQFGCEPDAFLTAFREELT